jgi:hypothetical protein
VHVDLIQCRGLVFLHSHVSDLVNDNIRRHYLSIVPFILNPRSRVLQKLNVKNFSFRSYPPYLDFNRPLGSFFPLVELLAANQVAQVRLVFNCGDALHTCVVTLCRALDQSAISDPGVRSELHLSSGFASNDWLESSSEDIDDQPTFRVEVRLSFSRCSIIHFEFLLIDHLYFTAFKSAFTGHRIHSAIIAFVTNGRQYCDRCCPAHNSLFVRTQCRRL